MTPVIHDFECFRGTKLGPLVLTARDTTGALVDLTGWTIYADARAQGAPDVVAFSMGATITDATAGEITIVKTDEETDAFDLGRYFYDVVLENVAGERFGPFATGIVSVKDLNTQVA